MLIKLLVLALILGLAYWWAGSRQAPKRRGPNSHWTSAGVAKVGYTNKDEAIARAVALHNKDGASMDVYRCAECGQWHVGHAHG